MGWVRVFGQIICYHVAVFVILFNLISKHDHVLKKFNFDLLTPTAGPGGRGGVCGPNICYHAAAFGGFL